MAYAIQHERQASTASGLDILAGIWLLISPFVLMFRGNGAATTNNVVLGIVIGLLAIWRMSTVPNNAWLSIVNVILGIWVLISPWAVGFATLRTATTNNVIMGIIVIILSLWSAMAAHGMAGTAPMSVNENLTDRP